MRLTVIALFIAALLLTIPAAAADPVVGVVGCSQTGNAMLGWSAIPGSVVWNQTEHPTGYEGGAIRDWYAEWPAGEHWVALHEKIFKNPQANIIWWQLCDRVYNPASKNMTRKVLRYIRETFPGTTIYVSPLAEFETPSACEKQNIENTKVLVDYIISPRKGVYRGPDLPTVLDAWRTDDCHVGSVGRAAFGEALHDFNWIEKDRARGVQ